MNPVYVGDCSIEEVPGSKLSGKRGQATTLTRVYEGNRNDLNAFLASNPVYITTDSEIPSMVLDAFDVEWNGPTVKVTFTFYGMPSGNAGNPNQLQSDASWEPRSVTLGTDNSSDGLWIVNYYSPTITYRYVIASQLSDPQYQNYSEDPSNITILDFSMAPGNPNLSTAGFQPSGNWQFSAFSVCTGFKRNQKGTVYNYAETWAVTIQPPSSNKATATSLSLSGVIAPSPSL